jgi:putative peptidoglycan lipid II flippase
VRIVSPTFYAIGESRVPAVVSTGAIAVNVVASVALIRMIGFGGLPLGTSVAALANAVALMWMLRRRLGGLEGRRLSLTLFKVTVAACVMAMSAVAIQHAMGRVLPGSPTAAQAVRLAVSIGGSLIVLAGAARILRLEEFDSAVAMTLGRVRKLLSQ